MAHQNFLASATEIKRFYRLAGFTFCLKFANPALVEALSLALKHLEIGEIDCDLPTVCIWDSFSTHSPSIEFPWPENSYAMRGEVLGYNDERIHTVVDVPAKMLQMFDKERNLALLWIKDHRELPEWVRGCPLQFIIHWWMRMQGHQLTHAAVVGTAQGGALLAGKGGAGKSTTCLSCMKAGMKYVSEDYCVLSDVPNIWAYCVYNSAKIKEETLNWFPELEKQIENGQRAKGDKAFLFHHKFQPEAILSGCPLKAIISLKIEETEDSWLKPTHPAGVIAALSASTLWQLTHTGPDVFNHLRRIAEALPCYTLHLGSDLMQAPKLIGGLL